MNEMNEWLAARLKLEASNSNWTDCLICQESLATPFIAVNFSFPVSLSLRH